VWRKQVLLFGNPKWKRPLGELGLNGRIKLERLLMNWIVEVGSRVDSSDSEHEY
jgi:hypothetical protein